MQWISSGERWGGNRPGYCKNGEGRGGLIKGCELDGGDFRDVEVEVEVDDGDTIGVDGVVVAEVVLREDVEFDFEVVRLLMLLLGIPSLFGKPEVSGVRGRVGNRGEERRGSGGPGWKSPCLVFLCGSCLLRCGPAGES